MLKSVSIKNVAVIKDLSVDLSDGFTVITGETGAGKSVFIDSLAIALGERAAKDMIRTGEDKAEVFALFDAPSSSFADENGEVELYRSVSSDGKTVAKIGGRTVPIQSLKNAARELITIHGQQDSGALSETSEIIKMLDAYIGNESELSDYAESYDEYCAITSRLDALRESLKDKAMMLDILSYQLKEIESAKITDADEEEKLTSLRVKLRSLEKISKNVAVIKKALIDNEKGITAVYLVDRAAAALRNLSDVMPDAEAKADALDSIRYDLTQTVDDAEGILGDEDMSDPERKLDAVEGRLSVLKRVRSKYGDTLADVMAKKEEIKRRLSELSNSDDAIEDLERSLGEARAVCEGKAEAIGNGRRDAAKKLTKTICEILADLDMPKVRFEIKVTKRISNGETVLDRRGFDDVDFLVSANVGEEMQPISRIASGGELSRIMLAVKSAMKKSVGITSVFDEIDAGVSGATSERIGRKLRQMSEGDQVICITHSAQIASLAHTHLKISKSEIDGRVESSVESLDRDGRIKELSRIIGGVMITKKVIDTAEEMLKKNC